MGKAELIVALDLVSEDEALDLVVRLLPDVDFFKVGLQLFVSSGSNVVSKIKDMGGRVFLDLKLHDIPNQVANAVTEASNLGVDLLTIHTFGGREMMSKVIEARDKADSDMKIVGVTILTSMDNNDLKGIGIESGTDLAVMHQAKLAIDSGLDGVVSSGYEVGNLRRELGDKPVLVTPGIRPGGIDNDDQKRSVTPLEAAEMGSDFLVVGRPVIFFDDPKAIALAIKREIE